MQLASALLFENQFHRPETHNRNAAGALRITFHGSPKAWMKQIAGSSGGTSQQADIGSVETIGRCSRC
jgi:hypothetical protein